MEIKDYCREIAIPPPISAPAAETKSVTIKEMFERVASREQEKIREARERHIAFGALQAKKHAH